MPLSGSTVRVILETVLSSLGQVIVLCGAGAVLTRREVITKDVRRSLAKVSADIAIPCLLFTSVIGGVNAELLTGGQWILVILPFIYVPCGLAVGRIAAALSCAPPDFRRGMITATAFGNSTGLPIVMLTVIRDNLILVNGRDVTRPPNAIAYLALYLLFYPVLQWGLGGWLLQPTEPQQPGATVADPSPMPSPVAAVRGGGNGDEGYATGTDSDGTSSGTSSSGGSASRRAPPAGSSPRSPLRSPRRAAGGGVNADAERGGATSPRSASSAKSDVPLLRRSRIAELAASARGLGRQFLVPPVAASLLGLVICLITPVRQLLISDMDSNGTSTTSLVPLGWLHDGIKRIGQAAVPLNMMVLGSNLSKGPVWSELPVTCAVAGVVAKMIVMPVIGLGICSVLRGWGAGPSDPLGETYGNRFNHEDDVTWIVALLVVGTPTANNICVMCELAGQNRQAMATLIFAQYLAAPVLLTASVVSVLVYIDQCV